MNPNSLKHYLNDVIRRYSASDIEVSELVEERRETVRLRRPKRRITSCSMRTAVLEADVPA